MRVADISLAASNEEPESATDADARSPRRILHVIGSLRPEDGGPPEGVRQLARNYQALGNVVEVVTNDRADAPHLHGLHFPVHALGNAHLRYGWSRRLRQWLGENVARFDLVVINGVWAYSGVAAWRAATGARVPYVVFTHGMLDVFFRHRYPAKHLKKMLYWPLQYTILRQARAVIFTSEAERELAAASFWPNRWASQVVPYGTNGPEGERSALEAAFYDLCPRLRGRRFLLFLSRIHEKKGCDLLIEAFARVQAQDPELDLVIAGPDRSGLKSRLSERAEALGLGGRLVWMDMLQGAAKFGAFAAAEAFVLPSHQENFGIVVAEALASGTPVLISDQVNIWRDIVADQVGLVEPDTLEGTCRLLTRWLALQPTARAEMAARARQSFETRYSLRRTAEQIVSFAAPGPAPSGSTAAAGLGLAQN